MFEIDPTKRYDMPVVFGPSDLPDVTNIGDTRTIAIPFKTEKAALTQYIPGFFTLPDEPVVTVSSSNFSDVDWLGAGRGYNVTRVTTPVSYDGSEKLTGPYSLVIWESDSKPVIAGREFQGYAKIVGRTPLHERTDDLAAFECFEYDDRLVRGEVSEPKAVPESKVSALNTGAPNIALGWKYIPSPEGGADADYPTKLVSYSTINAVWRGVGSITFDEPTWQQAPLSSRIIAALRDLPNLGYGSASIVHGANTLHRDDVRRLR